MENLTDEEQLILTENAYRSQMRDEWGFAEDSPLLKSRDKIKKIYGD